MDIDTIRTPSKGITMFSGHCNFAENVEYASHCCWSWGSDNPSGVTGALGQTTKNCHQTFETLNSKQRGLLNFYLHQVEGNREINLCRSFLIFEVPNFHSSWQQAKQHCGCLGRDVWLKKSSLLMIFSSLIFQAVQNVFLSIPCWYTPYKAWKFRETFRKMTNNGAPHRRETWNRCIFMTLL